MKNLSFKNNFKTTQKISKQKLRSNLVMALIFAICFSMLSMFSSTNFESWAEIKPPGEQSTTTNDGTSLNGLRKYNNKDKGQIPNPENSLDQRNSPSVPGLTKQARTAEVKNGWKVRFDPNGGYDFGTDEWGDIDITNGKFIIPSGDDPERTNFKFLGWALTPDRSQLVSDSILSASEIMLDSGYKYINDIKGAKYKIQDFIGKNPIKSDADVKDGYITLYAVWGYDVVFEDNTGEINDGGELDKDKFTGQFGDFAIPKDKPSNAPEGKVFLGWKVDGQEDPKTYSDLYGHNRPERGVVGIKYDNSSGGIEPTGGVLTLQAVYGYKVFFDVNLPFGVSEDNLKFGASFGGQNYEFEAAAAAAAKKEGWPHTLADKKQQGQWIGVIPGTDGEGSLTIPSQEPSLDGYKFTHWDYRANGLGSNASGGEEIDVKGHMVLYAQWENKTEIKFFDTKFVNGALEKSSELEYDSDESESDLTVEISKIQSGKRFNLPDVTQKVKDAHKGEVFVGWVCQSGKRETYNGGQSYTVESVGDTIEFWAVWKKLLSVTFDISTLNGAKFSDDLTEDSIKAIITKNDDVTVEIKNSKQVIISGLEPDTNISAVADLIKGKIEYTQNTKTRFKSWGSGFSSTASAIYIAVKKEVVENTLDEITLSYLKGLNVKAGENIENIPTGDIKFNADGTEVAVPNNTPTRDGYTFAGWKLYYYNSKYVEFKDTLDNPITVNKGGSLTIDSNITSQILNQSDGTYYKLYLVAQWTKDFVIEYKANAGSDTVTGMPYPLEQSVISGGSHTVSGATPERDGYDFVGWNTETDGLGDSYSSENKIEKIGKNITLYAQWTSDAKISFYDEDTEIDLNNLVLGETRKAKLIGSFEDKEGVALLSSSEISNIIAQHPEKVFVGWFCENDGNTYDPGENFIVPEGANLNIKFTAVWEDRLTVTFDISTLKDAKFSNGLETELNEKFGENNVVFETNKIIIKNLEPDTDISAVAELIEESIVNGNEFEFDAWDPEFSSKVTASAIYIAVKKEVVSNTLDEIKVVYYDGDKDSTGKVDDQDYKFNGNIIVQNKSVLELDEKAHDGEEFAGWLCYVNDEIVDSTRNDYWQGGERLKIDITSGTIKFVAQWLKQYEVKFELGEFAKFEDSVGVFSGASLSESKKTLTFNLVLGSSIPNITDENVKILDEYKTKKEFDGWDNEVSETVNGNVVYTAKYTEIINNSLADNIEITYNKNVDKGTIVEGMPATLTNNIVSGGNFKISEARPTREHYRFIGWAINSTATAKEDTYQPGGTISKVTGNITLYAIWEEHFKVIFEDDEKTVQTLYFDVEDENADSFNVLGCPTGVDEADFNGWSFGSEQYKAGEEINLGEKGYRNGQTITFNVLKKSEYEVSYVDDDDQPVYSDIEKTKQIEDTEHYQRSDSFIVLRQIPVKENATFLGWDVLGVNTEGLTLNDYGYIGGNTEIESTRVGSSNVTLKAKWSYHPNVVYLDSNGKELVNYYISAIDVSNITIGCNQNRIPLDVNNDPSFKYWSLKVDENAVDGNQYKLDGTYALKGRDKLHTYTFTAVYTKQYKVSYYDDDNTSDVYEYGTGEGEGFVAFTQDNHGNLLDSSSNEVFVKVTGNDFTVTDSEGREVTEATRRKIEDEKSYNQGVDYYTKVTDRLPYKEKATFCGWEDENNNKYDPDDMIPITGDITLEAVWRPHHEVEYVYEANGNNVLAGFTKYYDEGETVQVDKDGVIKNQLLNGWVTETEFDGWYNGYDQVVYGEISNSFTMPDTNVVIKPQISNKYQVVYKNGLPTGSTDTVENLPTDNNYYSKGDTVNFTENPTRDGYFFDGWVLKENTTGGVANDNAPIETEVYINDEDVTVYAKWTKKIRVTYKCGENYSGSVPTDDSEYEPGDTVNVKEGLTWEGHTFVGWTVDNDELVYGSIYTIPNDQKQDIEFVAKWENMYYVRVIDPRDDREVDRVGPFSKGDSTENSALEHWGQAVENMPKHDGYKFKGLSLERGATERTPNINITIGDSDVDVFIVWKNIFDVEFIKNADDVTLLYGTTSHKDVEKGESVGCPVITRTGYTFISWNTEADGTGDSYEGTSIQVNSNLTLYAQWEENDPGKATIKFIDFDNQDSSVKNWPSDKTVDKESSFNIDDVDKPTSDFYDFVGWYNSSGGSNEGSIKVDKDIVLFAMWTPKSFTVTFDPNGGTLTGSDSITKKYGEYITLPGKNDVSRDGFVLSGWAEEEVNYELGASFKVTKNTTLRAVWEEEEKVVTYEVEFNANNPEGVEGEVTNMPSRSEVESGGDFNIPNNIPVLDGYEFIGWAEDPSNTYANYKPKDSYRITGNITLYAVWKLKEITPDEPQVFNITFDKNCEVQVEDMPENTTHDASFGNYTLPIKTPWKIIEDDYVFNYWSTSPDETTAIYNAGATAKITSDTTFYAIWKLKLGGSENDPENPPPTVIGGSGDDAFVMGAGGDSGDSSGGGSGSSSIPDPVDAQESKKIQIVINHHYNKKNKDGVRELEGVDTDIMTVDANGNISIVDSHGDDVTDVYGDIDIEGIIDSEGNINIYKLIDANFKGVDHVYTGSSLDDDNNMILNINEIGARTDMLAIDFNYEYEVNTEGAVRYQVKHEYYQSEDPVTKTLDGVVSEERIVNGILDVDKDELMELKYTDKNNIEYEYKYVGHTEKDLGDVYSVVIKYVRESSVKSDVNISGDSINNASKPYVSDVSDILKSSKLNKNLDDKESQDKNKDINTVSDDLVDTGLPAVPCLVIILISMSSILVKFRFSKAKK